MSRDEQTPEPRDVDFYTAGTPALQKIEFTGGDPRGIFGRELRNVELTGVLSHHKTAPACNIVDTVIQSLTADTVDFTRCDFKDTAIRNSAFTRCDFRSSSFAYNAVFESSFDECSFSDTAIHSCEFIDVAFARCDLTNVLIKSSTFQRCTFTDCATNNKLFETCRFADCRFKGTDLQIQTIEENFGLTVAQYDGLLRDGRGDERHLRVPIEELTRVLEDRSRHAMQRLLVFYFLNGSLIEGSSHLDEALLLDSWLPNFRTAGSFAVVLTQWVQFILWLYERNELLAHTIIVLHTMISRLLSELSKRDAEHQALTAIRGAFASLARVVDEYIIAVDNLLESTDGRMRLIVEGEGGVEFYERGLAPLLERDGAHIVSIAPYNSWELIVAFIQHHPYAFITLLAAATPRMNIVYHMQKHELWFSELPGDASHSLMDQGQPAPDAATFTPPAALSASEMNTVPLEVYAARHVMRNRRLMAYRGGNLTAEFKLGGLSTATVGKIWKVVKRFESLLSDDP
jgi:hypothetical protein